MLKKSKLLPLVMAIFVAVSMLAAPVLAEEDTVPSQWAMEAVDGMWQNNLADSTLFTAYRANITREEFISLMVRFYETATETVLYQPAASPFSDISGSRYESDILKAWGAGLVSGTGNGRFNPAGEITRQEVAVMLYRTLRAAYPSEGFAVQENPAFRDSGSIAGWALEAVAYTYKNGILKGFPGNEIRPLGKATREQAMALVYRTAVSRNAVVGNGASFILMNHSHTYSPTQNDRKIQEEQQDVGGTAEKETVQLYARQRDEYMPMYWSVVVNGYERIRIGLEGGTYTLAQLKFDDVNGDGKQEILLYRYCTGSSGAQALSIYDTSDVEWREMLYACDPGSMNADRFEVKYTGNYAVSFSDKKTGIKANIPLQKELYKGMEDMLKDISTWVDPVAEYEIGETGSDGAKEITAVQRVIGVSHADTIGVLKTLYTLEDGQYRAKTLSLYTVDGMLLAEGKL